MQPPPARQHGANVRAHIQSLVPDYSQLYTACASQAARYVTILNRARQRKKRHIWVRQRAAAEEEEAYLGEVAGSSFLV